MGFNDAKQNSHSPSAPNWAIAIVLDGPGVVTRKTAPNAQVNFTLRAPTLRLRGPLFHSNYFTTLGPPLEHIFAIIISSANHTVVLFGHHCSISPFTLVNHVYLVLVLADESGAACGGFNCLIQ